MNDKTIGGGGKEVIILAIDTGTTETGYCILEAETYKPLQFGKVANSEILDIIRCVGEYGDARIAIEGFQSFGMPLGQSTIESITWNGRYIQLAEDNNIPWEYVYRKDEKIHLCGTMKAKDANIRQALIDRFGEVGVKKSPGFFYGFKGDIWSAMAIGVVALDRAGGV